MLCYLQCINFKIYSLVKKFKIYSNSPTQSSILHLNPTWRATSSQSNFISSKENFSYSAKLWFFYINKVIHNLISSYFVIIAYSISIVYSLLIAASAQVYALLISWIFLIQLGTFTFIKVAVENIFKERPKTDSSWGVRHYSYHRHWWHHPQFPRLPWTITLFFFFFCKRSCMQIKS